MIKSKRVIIFITLIAMVSMINLITGCDTNSVSENTDDQAMPLSVNPKDGSTTMQYKLKTETVQNFIYEDGPLKSSILNSVFASKNVTDGKAWLESQGYSYIESNSLVLIEQEIEYYSDSLLITEYTPPVYSKEFPDVAINEVLARADTVTWMTFENPAYDSTICTALLNYQNIYGQSKVVIFEFNLSTEPPTPLQQGYFDGGVFISEDMGLENWFECVGAGTVGSGIVCGFLGPGYIPCVGAGAVASLVGCTIYSVYKWLS